MMKQANLFCVLILLATSEQPALGTCPTGYIRLNDLDCYNFGSPFQGGSLSLSEAKARCASDGALLMWFDSLAELKTVQSGITGQSTFLYWVDIKPFSTCDGTATWDNGDTVADDILWDTGTCNTLNCGVINNVDEVLKAYDCELSSVILCRKRSPVTCTYNLGANVNSMYKDGDIVDAGVPVVESCQPGYTSTPPTKTRNCVDSGSDTGVFDVTSIQCTDIDECASIPCQNGGSCTNNVNSFTCVCTDGFDGIQCESVDTCSSLNALTDGEIIYNPSGEPHEFGTVATFTCNIGFIITGTIQQTATTTCFSGGTWDPSTLHTCSSFQCENPLTNHNNLAIILDDGTPVSESDVLVPHNVITISCQDGYISPELPEQTLTCNVNEQWSDIIKVECIEAMCVPLQTTGINGIDPDGNIIETDIGSWNPAQTSSVPYDTTAALVCDNGKPDNPWTAPAELQNPLTCKVAPSRITTEWQDSSGNAVSDIYCEYILCEDITNQLSSTVTFSLTFKPDTDFFIPGCTISMTCKDEYYNPTSSQVIHCLQSGVWDGSSLVCTEVTCAHPDTFLGETLNYSGTLLTTPDIGRFEPNEPHPYGAVVSALCTSDDWILNEVTSASMNKIQCDVKLDKSAPIWVKVGTRQGQDTASARCKRIVCPDPAAFVSNSQYISNPTNQDNGLYVKDSAFDMNCKTGYTSTTTLPLTYTCQANGTWLNSAGSTEPLVCTPVQCPMPELNAYVKGTFTQSSYDYLTELVLRCQTGYTSGSSPGDNPSQQITCKETANWDPDPSTYSCSIIQCSPSITAGPIANGQVELSGTGSEYGDIATFLCFQGYSVAGGSLSIHCQSNGQWSGDPASTCQPLDCGQLTADPNGQWIPSVGITTIGGRFEKQCNHGYKVLGDGVTTTVCSPTGGSDGKGGWSPILVNLTCQITTCPDLSNIDAPHATYPEVSTFEYGSSVTYSCDVGYHEATGSEMTITCGNDTVGQWTEPTPACETAQCEEPTELPGTGTISGSGRTYGDTAVYNCLNGYEMTSGDITLKCGENGWEGTVPTCSRKQCPAPEVKFAKVSPFKTDWVFEDQLSSECMTGYNYDRGSMTRICQADQQWSGTPIICLAVICPLPPEQVDHSSVVGEENTYGSTVMYECSEGHYMVGTASVTCGENGEWLGNPPQCLPNDCGIPPQIPGATPSFTSTTFSNTVVYKCNEGFTQKSSSLTLYCSPEGNWDGTRPVCEATTCLVQNVMYANASGQKVTFGNTVSYTCQTGYVLSGNGTLQCLADGSWSNVLPQCLGTSCGTPSPIDHGSVSSTEEVRHPAQVIYTCDAGYVKKAGDERQTCQADGTFSGVQLTCMRGSCGIPSDVDNAYKSTYEEVLFKDSVTYTCRLGYVHKGGDRIRQCQPSLTFSGQSPVCEAVTCPSPPQVHHSMMTEKKNSYIYGTVIRYECDLGYEKIQGDSTFICQINGEWSSRNFPVCNAKSCGDPGNVPHAIKSASGYLFMDIVIYKCEDGFQFKLGSIPQITCLTSGQWSHALPECISQETTTTTPTTTSTSTSTTTNSITTSTTTPLTTSSSSPSTTTTKLSTTTYQSATPKASPLVSDLLPLWITLGVGTPLFIFFLTLLICGYKVSRSKNRDEKHSHYTSSAETRVSGYDFPLKKVRLWRRPMY